MEEEFVKLTEVVLRFELKRVFNFKQLPRGGCFFSKNLQLDWSINEKTS